MTPITIKIVLSNAYSINSTNADDLVALINRLIYHARGNVVDTDIDRLNAWIKETTLPKNEGKIRDEILKLVNESRDFQYINAELNLELEDFTKSVEHMEINKWNLTFKAETNKFTCVNAYDRKLVLYSEDNALKFIELGRNESAVVIQ